MAGMFSWGEGSAAARCGPSAWAELRRASMAASDMPGMRSLSAALMEAALAAEGLCAAFGKPEGEMWSVEADCGSDAFDGVLEAARACAAALAQLEAASRPGAGMDLGCLGILAGSARAADELGRMLSGRAAARPAGEDALPEPSSKAGRRL